MTTKTKPVAHVSITYAVCLGAAALAVLGVQYATHNAVNQTVAGLLIPVLAQGLAYVLRATGQVDVPDAPAQVDLSALATELLPLVEASATRGSAAGATAAVQAALAPSGAASPDTHEAGAASEATPAAAATPAA